MTTYLVLNIIAILVNVFGASMYVGPPGLQFILVYLTIAVAVILSSCSLYSISKSKFHVALTLIIIVLTILTGLPLWLQDSLSGSEMRSLGRITCGISIPVQVILLFIAWTAGKRIHPNSKG